MASRLIIRNSNPPTRCDICHGSDQFDPLTLQCHRCADLPQTLFVTQKVPATLPPIDNANWQDRLMQYLVYSLIVTVVSFAATAIFGLMGAYPLVIITGAAAIFSAILLLFLIATLVCYIIYWTATSLIEAIYHRVRSIS